MQNLHTFIRYDTLAHIRTKQDNIRLFRP